MGYFPRFLSLGLTGQDVELTDVVGDLMSCPDVPCKLGVLLPFCNLWETWFSSGTGEIKSLKSHKTFFIQSNCLEFCRYLRDLPRQMRDRRWVKAPRLKSYRRWHKCDFFVDAEILKVNAWLSSVVKFVRPGRNAHCASTDQKTLNYLV